MEKLVLLGLLALSVIVFGCIQIPAQGASQQAPAAVTCNSPYIQVGSSCCLDANNNSICDKDETAPAVTPVQEGAATCNLPYIKVGTECCLDANNNSICDKDEAVAKTCPPDLQACPGGSTVGRNPDNNCDFYSCPLPLPEAANSTGNLSKPDCNYTTVLSAITGNLLQKSNSCSQTRISILCGACSTCCSTPGVAKSEYQQSIDPDCYTCANSNYGVARARDYYDPGGIYEHKCVANCPDLVSAYQAFLQYGKDYNCNLPDGWKICNDVTLG